MGLLVGLPQGMGMANDKLISMKGLGLIQSMPIDNGGLPSTNYQGLFVFLVAFGLFAPLFIAVMNTAFPNSWGSDLLRKINRYVNIYFMMVIFGLSLGISGWITLHLADLYDGRIAVCAFFVAGGIGLSFGYFIDTKLGRKSETNS